VSIQYFMGARSDGRMIHKAILAEGQSEGNTANKRA
jgi:hypothetical protein